MTQDHTPDDEIFYAEDEVDEENTASEPIEDIHGVSTRTPSIRFNDISAKRAFPDFLKKALVISAIIIGGYYTFGDTNTEHQEQTQAVTHVGNTVIVDVSDTPISITGPSNEAYINMMQTTYFPQTASIAKALDDTIRTTADFTSLYRTSPETQPILARPDRKELFCEHTKRILTATYKGKIDAFQCNAQDVSVVTKEGTASFSATTNRVILKAPRPPGA